MLSSEPDTDPLAEEPQERELPQRSARRLRWLALRTALGAWRSHVRWGRRCERVVRRAAVRMERTALANAWAAWHVYRMQIVRGKRAALRLTWLINNRVRRCFDSWVQEAAEGREQRRTPQQFAGRLRLQVLRSSPTTKRGGTGRKVQTESIRTTSTTSSSRATGSRTRGLSAPNWTAPTQSGKAARVSARTRLI